MLLSSNDDLNVVVDGASLDYVANYVTDDGSSAITPSVTTGSSSGSGTVTVVSAPTSGQSRLIDELSFFNSDTVVRTVTVRITTSGSPRTIRVASLYPDESLTYTRGAGWTRWDVQGRELAAVVDNRTGYNGFSRTLIKAGTAAEAAGRNYWFLKDAGLPGAVTVGTPGVAGRAVSNEAGAIPLPTPVGSNYLTQFVVSASVANTYELWDLLWINSGLVVTTTTAQTVNSVTLPARDDAGSTNGAGCVIGILFTAAATNGAAIANTTVSYTNSSGVAGRTATLVAVGGMQIPATPVIGTVVWFLLQAGDTGVQSIQSITLNTSLVTGSISLVIARKIDVAMCTTANLAAPGVGALGSESYPGIKLYSGTSLILGSVATATTAPAVQAICKFADR